MASGHLHAARHYQGMPPGWVQHRRLTRSAPVGSALSRACILRDTSTNVLDAGHTLVAATRCCYAPFKCINAARCNQQSGPTTRPQSTGAACLQSSQVSVRVEHKWHKCLLESSVCLVAKYSTLSRHATRRLSARSLLWHRKHH